MAKTVKDEIIEVKELKLRAFESIANKENNLALTSDILLGVGFIGLLIKIRLKRGLRTTWI